MLIGVHLSNRRTAQPQLTEGDKELLRLMVPALRAVKLFAYHKPDVWEWVFSTVQPELTVVRLDHLDFLSTLDEAYADYQGANVVVELGNEPNHEREMWGGDLDAFVEWYERVEAEVGARYPKWKRGFPGLSPQKRPERWLENRRIKALVRRADYLCAHAYYSRVDLLTDAVEGGSFQFEHLFYPEKMLLLTEFCYTGGEGGQPRERWRLAGDYVRYALWVKDRPYVRALCYFILGSDDPQWEKVGETFDETMARAIGGIRLGDSMESYVDILGDLARRFPEVAREWVKDGGGRNNLRKHLLGIGCIEPTLDDLEFLADEAIASATQVKNAIGMYRSGRFRG